MIDDFYLPSAVLQNAASDIFALVDGLSEGVAHCNIMSESIGKSLGTLMRDRYVDLTLVLALFGANFSSV